MRSGIVGNALFLSSPGIPDPSRLIETRRPSGSGWSGTDPLPVIAWLVPVIPLL
ncbi:hypothetical protein HPT29_019145 [Microvirga terrae]|uniref:Uncharacterized protein n=1 Tax=Microvirga terrae TaxID=2740529 RepID=A0ABY5RNW9_9HYPH|nr:MULTISPECIES: hypothetical protein [Microvirga]MBQ0823151.1 hypothetical protein [Microvirga sp. HBU67558]UVF18584.1 hypothetical protein HPT29_019145 [Microvirga terrae]